MMAYAINTKYFKHTGNKQKFSFNRPENTSERLSLFQTTKIAAKLFLDMNKHCFTFFVNNCLIFTVNPRS